MQTATSETKSKFLDLSICVHHYTLRAPCPKGQGNPTSLVMTRMHSRGCQIVPVQRSSRIMPCETCSPPVRPIRCGRPFRPLLL